MQIRKLGYLGLAATNVDAWRDFGADYLGVEVRELGDGGLGLRIDRQPFAFAVAQAGHDGLSYLGLEVDDAHALREATAQLRAAGFKVEPGTDVEIRAREVQALSWTLDPDGHRVEFYFGQKPLAAPFAPGRPIGGFRAGDLGFGHAVLLTPRLREMEDFYLRLLGFRVSDYMDRGDVQARFTHINPRHHSIALVAAEQPRLHHVMLEYEQFDDVGRLYDMAMARDGMVQVSLGRHSNDHMVSFYSRTPGGFLIETGWGGRLVDMARQQPEPLWCLSYWGHDRFWQSPQARQKSREDNAEAARRGAIAPIQASRRPAFDFSLDP
jgi:2,3-dihydroxybiphenyl 1,2-dioxygenase